MNYSLYCNKWINISGLKICQIPHGQIIWCEGGMYVSLYKRNMTRFSSMSISSSCVFFYFQLLLLCCWYIPSWKFAWELALQNLLETVCQLIPSIFFLVQNAFRFSEIYQMFFGNPVRRKVDMSLALVSLQLGAHPGCSPFL